jgi:hypothetical protein
MGYVIGAVGLGFGLNYRMSALKEWRSQVK